MSGKKFLAIIFFAMVTLLSCFSPVSSYFIQPRVSRTNDALIIDLGRFAYSPFLPGRGYSQFVNPGFIPVPSFNPYSLVQQQPLLYNGWPFYSRQAAAAQCGKGANTMPTNPVAGGRKQTLTDGRIAGTDAADAKNHVWTFMVALNVEGVSFCSGTLLSTTKILLAAQCFEQKSLYEISTVTVSVGGFLADKSDVQMTRRISQVVIHSRFNRATFANDIAIITMDMPVVFSRTVGPVCLPPISNDTDTYAGKDAVLLGWDKGAEPADGDTLQQSVATIPYNSECKEETTISKYVTDSTTCITSATAFTCLADIGGPLLVNSAPNTPGVTAVWTIVGINSFNAATSTTCTMGGLKTLVSAFIPWINTYNI